jgi:hypothetical protein
MPGRAVVPYVRNVQRPDGWPDRRGPYPDWPGGAVIAAALFHLLGAKSQADELGARPFTVLTVGLLLIGPLALYWRRKAPIAVLAVAAAASIAYAAYAAPRWVYAVAPVIAVFSASQMGRSRAALLTAAGAYTAYLLITSVFADELKVPAYARPELRVALLLAAAVVLAIVLGGAAKAQSEHMAEQM